MRQELVFRFHDPNSEKDTYNALVKVFTKVGCKKLKNSVAEYEKAQYNEDAAMQSE